MVQVVLTFDPSLGHMFHHFPLLSFLPCAPAKYVPAPIYYYLARPDAPADEYGRAILAPYGIRKIEAALVKKSKLKAVVMHPKHLERGIGPDTKIIAVNTMDPLGIGPLSLMFNNCGRNRSWVTQEFDELMRRINLLRRERCPNAKLIVGGAGEWEFEHKPFMLDYWSIDYVVQGEVDDIVHLMFEQMVDGWLDTSVFYFGYKSTTFDQNGRPYVTYVKDKNGRFITRNPFSKYKIPNVNEIPAIVAPAINGQVEIMRGCGINCDFCEVTTRPLRYYPPEKVIEEVMVNRRAGIRNAWFITDNQWAYMLKDPNFWPNKEAIFRLYREVMSTDGIVHANPMHATLAPVAADPELAFGISKIVGANLDKFIGVQIGLETGSDKLVLAHMSNKAKPLRVGVDATWAEIVIEAQKVYNAAYWMPAYTIIMGQAGETDDDIWDTIGLINYMYFEKLLFTVTPMALVNLGALRGTGVLTDVYANLTPAQAALMYVCWRNTKRMAEQLSWRVSKGNPIFRFLTSSILGYGSRFWLSSLEKHLRKMVPGAEAAIDKAKNYVTIKRMGTDFNKLRQQFRSLKMPAA